MKGEKERARRKRGGEEKKSGGCTLSFFNGYFRVTFLAEKNCSTQKVQGNVFKNPARYINIDKHVHKRIKLFPTK